MTVWRFKDVASGSCLRQLCRVISTSTAACVMGMDSLPHPRRFYLAATPLLPLLSPALLTSVLEQVFFKPSQLVSYPAI